MRESSRKLIRALSIQNDWTATEVADFCLMYCPEITEEIEDATGWTVEQARARRDQFGCELLAAAGVDTETKPMVLGREKRRPDSLSAVTWKGFYSKGKGSPRKKTTRGRKVSEAYTSTKKKGKT